MSETHRRPSSSSSVLSVKTNGTVAYVLPYDELVDCQLNKYCISRNKTIHPPCFKLHHHRALCIKIFPCQYRPITQSVDIIIIIIIASHSIHFSHMNKASPRSLMHSLEHLRDHHLPILQLLATVATIKNTYLDSCTRAITYGRGEENGGPARHGLGRYMATLPNRFHVPNTSAHDAS